VAFVLAGFAVVGMPGTSSFVAELTIFIGSFTTEGSQLVLFCAVLCVLTIVTTAVYVLRTVNRVVNGPLTKDYDFGDADTIEKTAIILLLLCIFGMGIFPGWIVELVDGSLQPILTSLEQGVR
jgi:NADH-quinone oxidoreductase subunit M